MVFIQAILYRGKPPTADIFMAKQQPIFEIGSLNMQTFFAMKTPFRVCVEAPISE